jgi:two-component system sensor histidine kinase ChiS
VANLDIVPNETLGTSESFPASRSALKCAFVRFAFLLLLALTSCADLAPHANAPVAKDGALDLSQWDFERDGPVTLDGKWDFIWSALPAEHDDLVTRPRTTSIDVPGQWDSNPDFDGVGYATYRLRLRLPALALALSKTHADSAWEMFADVDGSRTRVIGCGTPASTAPNEVACAKFSLGDLPRATDVVLVEGVSNFVYPRGGQGASTSIGTRQQLEDLRDAKRDRDFFLVGFILVVGIYHLVLFALRTSERAPLWFGLFCIVMATRDLERGRHLEDLLPALHLWAASKRVEYLGFYFAAPLFFAYLDAVLGYTMNRIAKRVFIGCWLALAVVVAAPPIVFGYTAKPAQVVVIAGIAWIIFAITRSFLRTGDRILLVVLLGFVILGSTILLDILSNADIIGLPILTPVGQAAFVVAQAAVIAAANARARKDVERLSKLKDEFLANTSHELRTPLNAIINIPHGILGQIEDRTAIVCSSCGAQFEAEDGADVDNMACPSCNATTLTLTSVKSYGDTGDALAAHLRSIIGSGEQLLAVVNDILDFSKLAAGQLTLRREGLDAADVVTRSLAVVAPLASAAKVSLVSRASVGVTLSADRVRLTQVLVNLVANAVKFSPAGAAVDVEASEAGGDVVFRVIDRGVGIAAEHHALIFESFRQVEAGHTRKHGGTGLGLSIVKQIVELHGGSVRVDSALAKGATFTVRLPRAPRREGSP